MIRHSGAKLIYLSHPRTASIATEHALHAVGFKRAPQMQRHAPLETCTWWTGLTPGERSRWTLMTTVRNPYDATVSWYLNRPYNHAEFGPAWLDDLIETETSHLTGGRLWELYGSVADVVMKFETLQADLEVLADYGVEVPDLPRKNVTEAKRDRHYSEFYSPDMRRAVRDRFADDFAEYGYRWRERQRAA